MNHRAFDAQIQPDNPNPPIVDPDPPDTPQPPDPYPVIDPPEPETEPSPAPPEPIPQYPPDVQY